VALLGLIALAGAAFTGQKAVAQYLDSHTPSSAVLRYFEALQSGDAAAALALSTPMADTPYLTNTVLRQQLKVAALADVTASTTSQTSTTAVVAIKYHLQFRDGTEVVDDRAQMIKQGTTWRILNGAGAVHVDAIGFGADRVALAGRPLVDQTAVFFPGALPLSTDTPLVVIPKHPHVTLRRDRTTVLVAPTLSDSAKRTVAEAVDKALAQCLTSANPDPHCPLPYTGRVVPGTLKGKAAPSFASAGASIDLASDGKGLISFGGVTEVTGTWKAWDFNNQVVTQSGKLGLPVQARASIDDLTTIRWVGP